MPKDVHYRTVYQCGKLDAIQMPSLRIKSKAPLNEMLFATKQDDFKNNTANKHF